MNDGVANERHEHESHALELFMEDFFGGTSTAPAAPTPVVTPGAMGAPVQAQIQLPPLSLVAPLHEGSAPATSAVPTLFATAIGTSASLPAPPTLYMANTQSAPPPRLLPAPHLSSDPLVLPPARLTTPTTPPAAVHLLGGSPITPALTSSPRSAPPVVQSAPVTPAQVPVSPLSPLLENGTEERFEPTATLARQMLMRDASTDSIELYKLLIAEIDSFVERLKNKMRDELRETVERGKTPLSPKQRTRLRSRRGAAVSRFRVNRKMIALRFAVQWCVAHIGVPHAIPPPPPIPTQTLPTLALTPGGSWRPGVGAGAGSSRSAGPGETMSPRILLAANLTALALRTPPGRAPVAPYIPPAMNLPPANTAPNVTDDALLSSVTKMPLISSCDDTEFTLSFALQNAIDTRHSTAQIEPLMAQLRMELIQFVDMRKGQVRDEYKTRLNEIGDKLTAKARMRGRSRRGAAVTRFKHTATIKAWEDALKCLVGKVHRIDAVPHRTG